VARSRPDEFSSASAPVPDPVPTRSVDVAIVGAGPAGLMAAEVLGGAGLSPVVFEKMPSPARKFLMAGRGGLNLTHSEPLEPFLARYGLAKEALGPLLRAFPPEALRAWCEGLGEATFVGTSGRVFPQSLKASPLLRAWLARLRSFGVELALRHRWTGFDRGALAFETPEGPLRVRAGAALLALGGASWPRLGSDGAWRTALTEVGVAVAPFAPANAGLRIAWTPAFRDRFEGEPLKRIVIAAGGAVSRGDAVVTRSGLEGGAVYPLSAALRHAGGAARAVSLDLRPDLEAPALARRLAATRPGATLSDRLRRAGLPPVAVGLLREAAGVRLPTDTEELASLVKGARLPVAGLQGLDRAISSAGGIRLEELDETLMVRRRPGLFAAGEMLDWEAPTGGYLLQASFATGVAAARGILALLGRG
jgi:uncharacterized flavoprotein (TIGR03862 family)